jgi:hypothetical protein
MKARLATAKPSASSIYRRSLTRLVILALLGGTLIAPKASWAQSVTFDTWVRRITDGITHDECTISLGATLGAGQELIGAKSCSVSHRLYNPVIPRPDHYVQFLGAASGSGTAERNGTLRTRMTATFQGSPVGDMAGGSIFAAVAEASWQGDLLLTPVVDQATDAARVEFTLECHGVLDAHFPDGIGAATARGDCSGALSRGPSNWLSGDVTKGIYADGADLVSYASAGGFAMGPHMPKAFTVSTLLTDAESQGLAHVNLWINSRSSVHADLYGGYFGTRHGIIPISSFASGDANLFNTLRILGVQVFAGDGTDVTAQYRVATDDGLVIPGLTPLTTPEPGPLLLVLGPLVAILSVYRFRPGRTHRT